MQLVAYALTDRSFDFIRLPRYLYRLSDEHSTAIISCDDSDYTVLLYPIHNCVYRGMVWTLGISIVGLSLITPKWIEAISEHDSMYVDYDPQAFGTHGIVFLSGQRYLLQIWISEACKIRGHAIVIPHLETHAQTLGDSRGTCSNNWGRCHAPNPKEHFLKYPKILLTIFYSWSQRFLHLCSIFIGGLKTTWKCFVCA